MGVSNSIEDEYCSWIDDAGGASDEDFRWTFDGLGDLPLTAAAGVGRESAYGEQGGSRKRARHQPCIGPKSKACREKVRRDRLNDRFLELSSVLDPGRPPKSDKSSILRDAVHALQELKSEAQKLQEANDKLLDTIKDLKAEKNELREEKMKLKADKERLEQQVQVTSLPPAGFLPHPAALHASAAAAAAAAAGAAYASQNKAQVNKTSPFPTPFPAYPGITMWHWLPSAVLDTTQDTKFWSPNA